MRWGHQGEAESRFQAQKSHILPHIIKCLCKGLKIPQTLLHCTYHQLKKLLYGLTKWQSPTAEAQGVNLNM